MAQEEASGRAAELWSDERQIGAWPLNQKRTSQMRIAEALRPALPAPADAAVIATSMAGLVSYWDRNAARLYGWSAREALGRNIVELTPAAQSRDEAAEIMRSLQAGSAWEGEIVLRRKGGRLLRAFVLDVPVEIECSGGGGIVGVSLPADRGEEIRCARREIVAELERRLAAA